MGSNIEITIPTWTESSAEEGVIANWFVAEGDAVRAGQALGELMVEKATIEISAPEDGVIQRVALHRGDVVKPGMVVAELSPATALASTLAQPGRAPDSTQAQPNHVAEAAAEAAFVPASPAARRLARELGVDLATIPRTNGRLTEEDVRRVAAMSAKATQSGSGASVAMATAGEIVMPLTGRRKVIAERMLRSLQSSAQLTLTTEVSADALMAARERLRPRMDMTYTDLVAWMVVRALQQHPQMNAALEGDQLRQHTSIHLGLAVAVPDGLLVPVIREAQRLSLAELANNAHALTERARTNACSPSELSGSTFSLTTLGMYDIDAFTPILNPPEVGILGIGRIREVIAPRDGQPSLAHAMTLSLTFDHRAVDGAPAAEFLQSVKRLIESHDAYAGAE